MRVLVPPSCVHRDRRPDLTVSGAPSPRFVFCFLKSFYFVPVCLSRGKEVAARHPALARVMSAWEFGGIAASPLAASPHARRSREISAAGGGSPKPAGWLPSSRVAAPPGVPFAGDHATGSPLTQACRIGADQCPLASPLSQSPPLTQCPPDHRWLKPAGSPLTQARRIAADSSLQDRRWLKPAGSPLTQACRIAADSSPPDRRWLKPAGSPLTQARRIAADSSPPDRRWLNARRIAADSSPPATAIPSPVDQVHMSRPGVPCCFVVPTGTF